MLTLSKLKPAAGSRSKKHRLGRGESSGWGKTAGRGHKGQKSRSGNGKIHVGFEGGQMPLHRRSPKWGFTQPSRKRYQVVNLSDLEAHFSSSEAVNPESLFSKKLIRNQEEPVKILATGELTKALEIAAHTFSQAATEKIEAAKGQVHRIELKEKNSVKA